MNESYYMEYKKALGKLLKEARRIKSRQIGHSYTGQMLADDLGVSRSFVGDMETGRTPIPYDLRTKIIEIIGLEDDYFDILKIGREPNNLSLFPEEKEKVHQGLPKDSNYKMASSTSASGMNMCDTHPRISSIRRKKSSKESIENKITNTEVGDAISLPVLGTVRAGSPIWAVQNIESYYPAPKNYLSPDKEYFYLRVKGDSMNLKFEDGSLILVEKTDYYDSGDIVVALIDGCDATVKKIKIEAATVITLNPMSTNPEYKSKAYDLLVDDVSIIGKAKMSINFL